MQVVGENVKSKFFDITITHMEGKPVVKIIDYLGQPFEPHKLVGTVKEMQRKNPPD